MRKFGSAAEASVLRIEHFQGRCHNGVHDRRRKLSRMLCKGLCLSEHGANHARLLSDICLFFMKCLRDGQQYALESWAAPVVLRRKVSATVKRLAIGREKCGERPAALPADRRYRRLVAAIYVRSLVAVHLHRDEILIH